MIRFNPELLTVTYHRMKKVTTALGGSITIVDPASDPAKPEYERIKIPFAVARAFIKETKFTQYMHPVDVAIMRYGDEIINLERDALSNIKEDVYKGDARWMSNLEKFRTISLEKKLAHNVWFFDGRYVYTFPNNELHDLRYGGPNIRYISRDLSFRAGWVECIDLYDIDAYRCLNILTESRGVIAFLAENEQFSVTPPIWKNVEAIGSSAAVDTEAKTDHEDYIDATTGVTISPERVVDLIDRLDDNFALNLNFTLNTAKSISNQFGFDSIEPLQLPEIMLSLQTVNIPSLPKAIKSTFSIGLSPSHGLAWLMGMLQKAEDMDGYLAVRAAIKYLTSKGMFHKYTTRPESLFIGDQYVLPPQVHFNADTIKALENEPDSAFTDVSVWNEVSV